MQNEHLHTILYNSFFFISLVVEQCKHIINVNNVVTTIGLMNKVVPQCSMNTSTQSYESYFISVSVSDSVNAGHAAKES